MTIALICVALLSILVFGLGLAVSLTRGRVGRIAGCPDDPADPLYKVVRAHGNTCEYAPILAVLMLALGALEPATWVLWCMGIVTAGRFVFAAGMLMSPTLAKPHPLRALGAASTYFGGLALCIALLASL